LNSAAGGNRDQLGGTLKNFPKNQEKGSPKKRKCAEKKEKWKEKFLEEAALSRQARKSVSLKKNKWEGGDQTPDGGKFEGVATKFTLGGK